MTNTTNNFLDITSTIEYTMNVSIEPIYIYFVNVNNVCVNHKKCILINNRKTKLVSCVGRLLIRSFLWGVFYACTIEFSLHI
jgi:hypothetical protein